MNIKYIALLSVVISLSGCKSKEALVGQDPVKEEEKVNEMFDAFDDYEEEDTYSMPVRERYNPSEKRVNNLIHTKLEVSFNWEKHQLNGKATVDLKPHFYKTDSLTLDAKGFDIKRVSIIKDGQYSDLKYDYDGMFLAIDLDKTYTRDEQYRIYVDYVAKPDELEEGGSAAITSDKGLYFINSDSTELNKATQIWTQGETEASSCWFPTIDAPNQKMTQEIEITVDNKYKTLSNGVMSHSEDNGDGTRTDYWAQNLPHVPYLVMMTVGDFSVVKDTWTKKNGEKIEVNYYVEKEYEKYAKDIFGETPNMLTYFSELLGVEYPWQKYSQVVVRDYVSGAMENTTATIHGDFLYRTKRELLDEHNESIIAHELFHHWFGDLVTCESWANLPLNESFANYSQYLWDEHKHGLDEAEYNAETEKMGYIYTAKQSGYVDMIRYNYGDKEEMFDGNSYNKGGRILHMLRNYIGDEAFFAGLNKYLEDNKFKAAEIDHLRLAFEEVTGEDLHWFFNQWFLDKGHPMLTFEQNIDTLENKVYVTLRQTQDLEQIPLYKLPIAIDIYSNGKTERHDVILDQYEQTFRFKTNGKVDLVNIGAKKILLAEIEEDKPLAQLIYQYYHAPLYADRKEAIKACADEEGEEAVKVIIDALSDKFWGLRSLSMRYLKIAVRQKPEMVKAKLISLAKNDKVANVRGTALNMLNKHFEDDADLIGLYEEGLKDQSYNVMAISLSSISELDGKKAYSYAKKLEHEESSAIKTSIGNVYAKHGTKVDNEFFTSNMSKVNGFNKLGFLKTYARYLKNMDDETIMSNVYIYEDIAKNGGTMWEKYFGGYQTIADLKAMFEERKTAAQTKIKSLTAEGAPASDIMLIEREEAEAKKSAKTLEEILNKLKAQETNQQILDFLDMGASYEILED